jgi:hypothetical protein
LKKIAFDGETDKPIAYRWNEDKARQYYLDDETRCVTDAMNLEIALSEIDLGDFRYRNLEELWEEHHRRKMKGEGDKYAAIMPKPERLYMGQYPLPITSKGSSDKKSRTVILRESRGIRSDDREMLWRMFTRIQSDFYK